MTLPVPFPEVPDGLGEHTLLCGRHFYTFPSELLEEIVEGIGERHFDREILNLDRRLSRANGDHASRIGYHNGRPIRYDLLGEPRAIAIDLLEIPKDLRRRLNWPKNFGQNTVTLKRADQRLAWVRRGPGLRRLVGAEPAVHQRTSPLLPAVFRSDPGVGPDRPATRPRRSWGLRQRTKHRFAQEV